MKQLSDYKPCFSSTNRVVVIGANPVPASIAGTTAVKPIDTPSLEEWSDVEHPSPIPAAPIPYVAFLSRCTWRDSACTVGALCDSGRGPAEAGQCRWEYRGSKLSHLP